MKINRYIYPDISFFITILATVVALVSSPLSVYSAGLTFNGINLPAISIKPNVNTGLEELYVVDTVEGVSLIYTASSPAAQVRMYRYSNLGGGYAEEIQGVAHSGNEWRLNNFEGDMGYIIDEGDSRHCYWIVDYQEHPLSLESVNPLPSDECDRVTLDFIGEADKILYYTINGRQEELDRQITLTYNTLEYNEESEDYVEITRTLNLPSITGNLHVDSPLCDTRFILSGDRFAIEWGKGESVESQLYSATAVEAFTVAEQEERESDNEQAEDYGGDILGGSAPVVVTFKAVTTPAAIFHEWQESHDPEFEDIRTRYNQLELNQTFTEMGTTYFRFVAADASGLCEYYGPTYTIQIGESILQIPNAFSPNASEGVNDEWRVSYKSIVKFECHIFNRYGEKMITLTDPSQGWDGRYKGKFVPAGVYFYVIKAVGSDGKKYNKSGDINIINYK